MESERTKRASRPNRPWAACLLIAALCPVGTAGLSLAQAQKSPIGPPVLLTPQDLPNLGQQITPFAPKDSGGFFSPLDPGSLMLPGWLAGQAVSTATSPDRKTLLVLTSGFNLYFVPDAGSDYGFAATASEYVFVFDISTSVPVQRQVLTFESTYGGIVFDPGGEAFYVSGGGKDVVHVIVRNAAGTWVESPEGKIDLGHKLGVGLGLPIPPEDPILHHVNDQVSVKPCAAGLAVSDDGKFLVVANYYNDSITILYGGLGRWTRWRELDLRPGKTDLSLAGAPGGTYPFWVEVVGTGPYARAYVSSIRDREVVVADVGAVSPRIMARIKVRGQPNKMALNRSRTRLYVVEDQSDTVDVIDTASNEIVETIPLLSGASTLPASLDGLTGANPNSAALSPDEKQLYVTFGNLNCVAAVDLGGNGVPARVAGLIPTGWYPNSASFGAPGSAPDGKSPMVFVVNGKSPTGANPQFGYFTDGSCLSCLLSNQYNPQRTKAGFQGFPLPLSGQLAALTAQVAANDRFSSTVSRSDAAVLSAVQEGVKHVVFVIKENRTYDQILGDLKDAAGRRLGDGLDSMAMFGESVTPNQHQLARQFVTLDRFFCSAETSFDGWPWTTSARAPDVVQKQFPVAYAGKGLSLDSEGSNRSVNVAYRTLKERREANPVMPDDPDILAGQTNVTAPDGPDNEVNTGYLWDAALRAGLSVRNYGFFLDATRYNLDASSSSYLPRTRDPFRAKQVVAYPTSVSLASLTDQYFRGFDAGFPDFHRFKEWEREFDALDGKNPLPALTLVRFMADHTGNFKAAIDGVNTPERQVADNDYALGLLIEKISKSAYAGSTLVFVIEDDSQDGGDHVDSHRAPAFVVGPYVKRGVVVPTSYNTIDFIRTIELVLGLKPMNLNDALARPMADLFDTTPKPWTFKAVPSPHLYCTDLPLPLKPAGVECPPSTHDAAYWEKATEGMDFSSEDRFDFAAYNRILWKGLKGTPYPVDPTRPGGIGSR